MSPPPDPTPPSTHPETLGRQALAPGSDELRALLVRRPLRVVADVALYAALIVGAFALFAYRPSIATFAIAFVVVGNSQYALSILTHDGNHATLFRKRSTNDWFTRWVLCAPLGVDFEGERHNHLEHHRLFATKGDPDRYLYVLEDKNSRGRLLLFLTGLSSLPHILEKARRKVPAPDDGRAPPGFFSRGRRPTLLAQVTIVLLVSRVLPVGYYVALWLAPLYVMAFVPHKVRMLCEHAQLVLPDDAADAHRLLTFRPNAIERQLVAPFGLNYHAEHHMFPGVPYHALPGLAARVEAHPGVEVRKSYLAFLATLLRRVPLVAAA